MNDTIEAPGWIEPVYNGNHTFNIIAGGRNSLKTYETAKFIVTAALENHNINIICSRYIQKSIEDSMHPVIAEQIENMGVQKYFKITERKIVCTLTKSEFRFLGLWRHVDSIKSIPRAKIIWIEEASNISKRSWDILVRTVNRIPGCKIICTLNPEFEDDVIYDEFLQPGTVRKGAYVKRVTYHDNIYGLSPEAKEDIEYLKRKNYDEYRHIYLGECKRSSQAQIFKDYYSVAKFEDPPGVVPYYGLDHGFNPDPLACVRCYIVDNTLYISHEAVGTEIELDEIPGFLAQHMPESFVGLRGATITSDKNQLITNNLRTEYKLNIKEAVKGPDSVEAGIKYMKSFDRIIIHERCVHTIREFLRYQHKINQRSGNVLREIEDKNNHCIDAIRYALEDLLLNINKGYTGYKTPQTTRYNKRSNYSNSQNIRQRIYY